MECCEYFTDRCLDQQICKTVTGSGSFVYYNDLFALEIVDKSGCGVDCQGSAANDQHLRILNIADSRAQDLVVQTLLIENHIRLNRAAASGTSGHIGTVYHCIYIMEGTAALAVIAQHRAMQLQHFLAACY